MSKKKRRVPSTSPQARKNPRNLVGDVTFNISKAVNDYVIAKRLHAHFMTKGHPIQLHFGGIVFGYDDWFELLQISQDKFDEVQVKLDKKAMEDEIERLIPIFEEQWQKFIGSGQPLVLLPGEVNPVEMKSQMDVFKNKLEGKR